MFKLLVFSNGGLLSTLLLRLWPIALLLFALLSTVCLNFYAAAANAPDDGAPLKGLTVNETSAAQYFDPTFPGNKTIKQYAQYFGDKDGRMNIADIIETDHLFKPFTAHTMIKNAKMHWYRLPLKNSTNAPITRIVSTGVATASTLDAFWVTSGSIKAIAKKDALSRFATQTNLRISATIDAKSEGFLYIQYSGIAQYPLDIQILTPEQYLDRTFKFTLLNGMTIGIIAVFLLFFSIHFIISRRNYLGYYCLFILGIQMFAIQVFGYGSRFYWPDNATLDSQLTHLAAGSIYSFYFLFSAHLFDHNRKFFMALVSLALIAAVVCGLGLFFNLDMLLTLVIAIGMPVAITAAYKALSRQRSTAMFFIAGSAVHYVCTFLLLLMLMGVPFGTWVFSLSTLGQLVDIICFSTAILMNNRQTERLLDLQVSQRMTDIQTLSASEEFANSLKQQNKNMILESSRTAHDMQQVLASLRLQLALQPPGQDNLELLQHTLQYAGQLLNQRVKQGKQDFTHINQHLNIYDVLQKNAQRHQISHPSLRFKAHTKTLYCSELAINRIVDNLVSNAFKYSGTKNIMLTGRATKAGYKIQVWDQGRGIPADKLERIFEPFKQISNTDIEDLGHGLGLNIVKILCDEFGYRFSVNSVKGKGTCFSVELLEQN